MNRFRPAHPADLERNRFRTIEPGIRACVRELVRVGVFPVWSCEGHRHGWRVRYRWMTKNMRRACSWGRRPCVVLASWRRRMTLESIGVAGIRIRGPMRVILFNFHVLPRKKAGTLRDVAPYARVFALVAFKDRKAAEPLAPLGPRRKR